MTDKKTINEKETIALLLYLLEDLKTKVLNKGEFAPYQLPTLNSIIRCVEEFHVLPLQEQEFLKIVIDTERHMLYAQGELQL